MKRARKCRKCGCTERKACIEFDSKGLGWPCCWVFVAPDGSVELGSLCSACVRGKSPGLMLNGASGAVPLVVVPQLAGYVARPR